MKLCVRTAKMPRKDFISLFPGNEMNLKWASNVGRTKKAYADTIKTLQPEILKSQEKLALIFEGSLLTLDEVKDINRKISIGEAKAVVLKKKWLKPTCDW